MAQEFAETLDAVSNAATEATRGAALKRLNEETKTFWGGHMSGASAFEKLGGDINDYVDAAMGSEEANKRVRALLDNVSKTNDRGNGLSTWGKETADAVHDATQALDETQAAMGKAAEMNDQAARAGVANASAQDKLAGSANQAAKAMEDQAKATHDLIDAQKTLQDIILGERGSWRNLYDAIDAANAAVEKRADARHHDGGWPRQPGRARRPRQIRLGARRIHGEERRHHGGHAGRNAADARQLHQRRSIDGPVS